MGKNLTLTGSLPTAKIISVNLFLEERDEVVWN